MSKNFKKASKMLTMFALVAALLIPAISPAMAAAVKKAPTLNSEEETVLMGKTFNFNINDAIKGATYKWTSTNTKVAVVDERGIVTGVDKGKTNIDCIVTTTKNIRYRLRAKVTVLKPALKVEINNKITHLNVGESYNLNLTISPVSSTDIVSWTTSDKAIANPAGNGVFKALKAGTVTITATALSGRKDSVTIQVLALGEDYVEVAEPTKAPEKVEDSTPVVAPGTIFTEDFSKSVGSFTARSAVISQVNEVGADGKKGYLSVTGRAAAWNGASVDVTSLVKPGKSYQVTGWVKYTEGGDSEVFKISQQKNGGSWPAITGDVTVEKGQWTKLTGTMVVDADTTQCEVYFETASNATISFLCDDMVIINPTGETVVAPVKTEAPKLPEGVVYANDFEGGLVCDSRGTSVRAISTKFAHNGKSSVEVTRTAGWDGAGVRFNTANSIVKSDYFGKTVHTALYVMYNDGPDTVGFKLNNRMEAADNTDTILAQTTVKKGEWTLLEADCKIANNATGEIIFVETDGDVALTFYMDDINIKVVK